MEITKVVKPFIRRGANTFGNIVYMDGWMQRMQKYLLNKIWSQVINDVKGQGCGDNLTVRYYEQPRLGLGLKLNCIELLSKKTTTKKMQVASPKVKRSKPVTWYSFLF